MHVEFREHFPSRQQKENWQWRTCFVSKHSKVDEETAEDKIYENLNKKLEEIKAFEEKVKGSSFDDIPYGVGDGNGAGGDWLQCE